MIQKRKKNKQKAAAESVEQQNSTGAENISAGENENVENTHDAQNARINATDFFGDILV